MTQQTFTRSRNGKTWLCVRWLNPLVCVCPSPSADPRVDYGMCQVCKRKPLTLFAANRP